MPETAVPRWFEFEDYRLDTRVRALWRGTRLVALPPKALDTLVALLRHAGDVVLKQDLIAEVWPDTAIDETGLAHNIWVLRTMLGAAGRGIKTVPKRGYTFVGRVRSLDAPAERPGHAAIVDGQHGATRASEQDPSPVVLAWCDACERHVWTATVAEALEATGTSKAAFAEFVDRGLVHYTDTAPKRVNLCMPSFIQALAGTMRL